MATRNIVFGSSNGDKEIDLIDVGALALLPTAASLIFGVFTVQIDVFGGYDFTQALWEIGGASISPALIIVVASVVWIAATNLANTKTEMSDYELGAVGASLALPLAYVFVPAIADLVAYHDLFRLAAVMYVSIGAVYISYVG